MNIKFLKNLLSNTVNKEQYEYQETMLTNLKKTLDSREDLLNEKQEEIDALNHMNESLRYQLECAKRQISVLHKQLLEIDAECNAYQDVALRYAKRAGIKEPGRALMKAVDRALSKPNPKE